MIKVTSAALEQFKKILEDYLKGHSMKKADQPGIRIGVIPGGCGGFSYDLQITEAYEDDEVVKIDSIYFYIDPVIKGYLEGVTIDYASSAMGAGFSFLNPNITGSCGCGSSFTV